MTPPYPIRLLINALRSDEYKQGTRFLATTPPDTCHCILGVAAEVAHKHGIPFVRVERGSGAIYFDGLAASLTPKIQAFYGFRGYYGEHRDKKQPSLVALNDVKCMPFRDIADLLEEHWQDYSTLEVKE